jgi:hypothetical protein
MCSSTQEEPRSASLLSRPCEISERQGSFLSLSVLEPPPSEGWAGGLGLTLKGGAIARQYRDHSVGALITAHIFLLGD